MKITKKINDFASSIVDIFAKYDRISARYELTTSDVPEFILDEFSALFMADESCAAEANSPDNKAYDSKMLPALLSYLKDTTNRDLEIEFTKAWREGVRAYFIDTIQDVLDTHCNDRLHAEQNDAGLYARRHADNGEIYWGNAL